jgi:hypothetical protein
MRHSPLAESIVLALPLAARANAATQHSESSESKQPQGFAGALPVGRSAPESVGAEPSLLPSSVRDLVDYLRAQTLIVPSMGENIPGEGQ